MSATNVSQLTSTPSADSPSLPPDDNQLAEILGGVLVSCCLVVIGIVILVTVLIVIGRKIRKRRKPSDNGQVDFGGKYNYSSQVSLIL